MHGDFLHCESMVDLTAILRSTLHTSAKKRKAAEEFVKKWLSSNGKSYYFEVLHVSLILLHVAEFVYLLLDFARNKGNDLHLRQLSLVLISQQVRLGLSFLSSKERSVLCEASIEILGSPERLIQNCGV